MSKPPHDVDTPLVTMLLVCKQLNEEGLNTFYKTNIFSFEDPTSFHIFVSRLSSTRSSLLRKIELIAQDDNDALGTLIARRTLAAPPYFWRLGGNDMNAVTKLASVTHIEIVLSVMNLHSRGINWDLARPHKVSHINRWLRYVFGGLRALRSIRQMEVYLECPDKEPYLTKRNRWSDVDLDRATVDSIIDEFKREVLSHTGDLT